MTVLAGDVLQPMWVQMVVIYGYYFGTLLLVALNKRHRSISDVVAGTVVVYSRCLEKIAVFKEESE